MTKPIITKISDKLVKTSDSFTVHIHDNSYLLEINGRNSKDDWATAKIACATLEDLFNLITEAAEMERD
jgi:hypothetical protein